VRAARHKNAPPSFASTGHGIQLDRATLVGWIKLAATLYQIPISSLYPGGIPGIAAVIVILAGTKLVPRYSGTMATSLIPPRIALSSSAVELLFISEM